MRMARVEVCHEWARVLGGLPIRPKPVVFEKPFKELPVLFVFALGGEKGPFLDELRCDG